MKWRRGIAFAAVHLTVGLTMVAVIEANEIAELRSMHAQDTPIAEVPKDAAASPSAPSSDAPTFDMCGMLDLFSPSETILDFANPVPFLSTGWRNPCAPRWSVSGMLVDTDWPKPSFTQFAKEQKVYAIFLLLISFQWLLIGGFPLRPRHGLWGDPATRITACTVVAGALSFVPHVESFCTLPMLYAFAAWIWWLWLIIAKLFRSTLDHVKSWRLAHAK